MCVGVQGKMIQDYADRNSHQKAHTQIYRLDSNRRQEPIEFKGLHFLTFLPKSLSLQAAVPPASPWCTAWSTERSRGHQGVPGLPGLPGLGLDARVVWEMLRWSHLGGMRSCRSSTSETCTVKPGGQFASLDQPRVRELLPEKKVDFLAYKTDCLTAEVRASGQTKTPGI